MWSCRRGTAERGTQNAADASAGETENAQETEAAGEAAASGDSLQDRCDPPDRVCGADAANEGFGAALNDAGINYTDLISRTHRTIKSACQTIAEKLVNDGNDLDTCHCNSCSTGSGRCDK